MTSSVSPRLQPTADFPKRNSTATTATWERRLQAEWSLLCDLARLNPGRVMQVRALDDTFHVTLAETPAISVNSQQIENSHSLRIFYPRFFPMVPMEVYLAQPVRHPNIHPETGFVCLWDRHRVSNNVEHAIHKTVAMLGWRLWNREEMHIMQLDCLPLITDADDAMKQSLHSAQLFGIEHARHNERMHEQVPQRRSRLS